jgi:hypothetical protein
MERIFGMLITSYLESIDPPEPSNELPGNWRPRYRPDPERPLAKELAVTAMQKASSTANARQARKLGLAEELSKDAIAHLHQRYLSKPLQCFHCWLLIVCSLEVVGALESDELLHFKPILDLGKIDAEDEGDLEDDTHKV